MLGTQKALHASLPKGIDRLFRIAYQEDSLRTAVPGMGEQFKEAVLAYRGVLHLVYEQVLQPCAGNGSRFPLAFCVHEVTGGEG